MVLQETSMQDTMNRSLGFAALTAGLIFSAAGSLAFAQNSDHEWQKEYQVGDAAALTVETGDSSLNVHSCGGCKTIRVHVMSGKSLNDFRLEEHQDGSHVYFTLRDKSSMHFGMHIVRKSEQPHVDVETPGSLELDARTSDGDLTATGLTGNLQVHSGDGAVTLEDVHGSLRLTASDGRVAVRRASGTLDARGADGHMTIDGQFTAVNVRTSDGNLDLALAPGSQLTAASRIESSDGRVTIKIPQNLSADLDVSTSDGHLECTLPLTMDHYSSKESSGHHLHGRLNAGGVSLEIHTSDGSLNVASL
jgi:hypothetical protein